MSIHNCKEVHTNIIRCIVTFVWLEQIFCVETITLLQKILQTKTIIVNKFIYHFFKGRVETMSKELKGENKAYDN